MWDLLLIVSMLLFAYSGFRRGLIISLFSIAGYFISLNVAKAFSPQVTEFIIANTQIVSWVDKFLGDKIRTASGMNIATNMITNAATKTIISVICFFIIFSLTSFIISRIARLANNVGRLPFIGGINKTGGLVFGTVKGLILIFILLAVLSFVAGAGIKDIEKTINDTLVVKLMYENNPVIYLINEVLETKNTPASNNYVSRGQSVFYF